MDAPPGPLASLQQPVSALGVHVRRATASLVGRPIELDAIRHELALARSGRMTALTVEGEPGIGKTRLLFAASQIASAEGFAIIAATADEEIRGPFLLARSILGAPQVAEAASGSAAEEAVARSLEALTGREEPGLEALPPDQKLLRTLDLSAIALGALAGQRPLAILIDDLQWGDDDSLRLLRYVVRTCTSSPIFVMIAIRPEELAFVTEAVNLVADMERLGLIRRLRLDRFTQVETIDFLRQLLGGKIDPASGAAVHAQAEGVPFIIEEVAHAYRDAGMVQEIDGVWTLAKNAERLLPSGVRTLISRRSARLPDETKHVLAKAAILGRHFSLKDLVALQVELGEEETTPEVLDETLAPAVRNGLLLQHAEDAAADYSFAHDHVREFSAGALSATRRRAIHRAIVELLLAGQPAPESLPLLAYHAKAAGDAPLCVRFSLQAVENALAARAPEEVLRVLDLALPMTSTPQERVGLLKARDDALDMLRRSTDRVQGLAELSALAEALGDAGLETEVELRRAAALRLSEEWDQAAELATRIRDRAAGQGDKRGELQACLELGQALLRSAIGEGHDLSVPEKFDDPVPAEEVYKQAAELARELGDDASLAAATRELGVIDFGRLRAYFIERVQAGEQYQFMERVASGETLDTLMSETPVAPIAKRATKRLEKALELYERIGDRRGAMSAIIAMAYLTWGPDIHFGRGAGRHIEEIRRLLSRTDTMAKESERSLAEAQMLYGAHVFSRAKVVPDLAISRAEEAHRKALAMGDRLIEFLAAGGAAMAYLDLGELDPAEMWLNRAAAAASEAPTPFRARLLETWRGLWRAAARDAEGMRSHLERAVQLATEQGRPAARCEALTLLAVEAARMGIERDDEELVALAERSAEEAKSIVELLPGQPPWGAQADAALASIALARGEIEDAVAAARSAFQALNSSYQEDAHLEVFVPVAEALLAGGTEEEQEMVRMFLRLTLAMAAQRTADEDVRVRWLRGPWGRELVRLVGPLDEQALRPAGDGAPALADADSKLLGLLAEGLTNREIAARLGVAEVEVTRRLGEMLGRIGASSRAEATAFAFREGVV